MSIFDVYTCECYSTEDPWYTKLEHIDLHLEHNLDIYKSHGIYPKTEPLELEIPFSERSES